MCNPSFSAIHFQPFIFSHSFSTIRFQPFIFNHSFSTIHFQPFVFNHSFSTIPFQPFIINHSFSTIHFIPSPHRLIFVTLLLSVTIVLFFWSAFHCHMFSVVQFWFPMLWVFSPVWSGWQYWLAFPRVVIGQKHNKNPGGGRGRGRGRGRWNNRYWV